MPESLASVFTPEADTASGGPLYLRVSRRIEKAIDKGIIKPGDALPSERDIAEMSGISRVTVRKAVQDLVRSGILVQRHGSGTFVTQKVERVEQSLSQLTSFTEDMARRGKTVRSVWLERGVFEASPEETMMLGLTAGEKVTRIKRLRIADGTPLAIERAVMSVSSLPDPDKIGLSLYAALEEQGCRPVRAMQRISAISLEEADAALLEVEPGSASLRIERVSYLSSGRVVEITRSIYRGDAYDFVAELRLQGQ
ncbi:MAG: GntR family transcriptional regulator [Rhizobiaceae bacterium]